MAVNTRPISAGQAYDVLLQGFRTQAAGGIKLVRFHLQGIL